MPTEIQEGKRLRYFPRFTAPYRSCAGFITGNRRIPGELKKISLRGLSLRTKESVSVGSVGKVGVQFQDWFFRATVIVRSAEPGRWLGFEFIKMCSLDRQALRLFCGAQSRMAVENKSAS